MSKLSAWDRFMLAVAPRWTFDRMRARSAATEFARHYEAAQASRRTSGWARSKADVNTVTAKAGAELRGHARDLTRNNSWARRAQNIVANNSVGWGIVPKSADLDASLNAKAAALWRQWADSTQCDSAGRQTFAGIQRQATRSIVTDGEVLIRRRYRRLTDGLAVPLQLQVLEADFLDSGKDEPDAPGGPIVQGVEFDKLGRRVAYWLFEEHPGSSRFVSAKSRRIPAEEILHVFDAERPDQARGVSWLGAAIVNLKDLDELDDAELLRQKVAACFAAFVTDTDGAATPLGAEVPSDERLDALEPGMISNLPPGKEITFANPPAVTADALAQRTLRRVAAGVGITYEDLTGDYSQVNFSSARMGRLVHQAHVRAWQSFMLIPLLCDGVWRWAMEAAVIAGDLPSAPSATWTAPPLPMIEPDREGLALQRLVRVGAMTHDEMVREQGEDPETHWAAYAAGLKRLDELGIKLDSDVRAVSAAGLTQERVGLATAPAADEKKPA